MDLKRSKDALSYRFQAVSQKPCAAFLFCISVSIIKRSVCAVRSYMGTKEATDSDGYL